MSTSLLLYRLLFSFLIFFSGTSSIANDFTTSFMASCNRVAMKDGLSSNVSNFYCNCALNYVVRANSLANTVVQNAQKYCIARTQSQFQQKAPTNIYDFLIEYDRQSGQTIRCMLTGNCNN